MGTLKNLTEELEPKVLEMYDSGIGTGRIGVLLGVPSQQVLKFVRENRKMRTREEINKLKSEGVGMNKSALRDSNIERDSRIKNFQKLEVKRRD